MISILLATYNGEKHLREQIESLFSQTVQDFQVYVCDDCSTDDTFAILQKYHSKYPNRFFITQNSQNTGSAKYNFIQLMIDHKDDYVMLCDQDDIWLPTKIELTLQKMQELEQKHGINTPILIHTDLTVVDEQLAVISPSFKQAMVANYDRTQLRQLIIQNILTGCTAMYNQALAQLITETPSFMVMHDWWLVLVAGAFGVIDHIDEQTILYRQHGDNSIGAKNIRSMWYKSKMLLRWQEIKSAIANTYPQAQSLLDLYQDTLSSTDSVLLQTYCSIPKYGKLKRIFLICELKTLKHGIARKIANIMFI